MKKKFKTIEEFNKEIEDVRKNIGDNVNHPNHYTFGKYEVIDVLMDWFPDEPLLWQVNKYIARANHKGRTLEDLQKAEFYLKRRIEIEKAKFVKRGNK